MTWREGEPVPPWPLPGSHPHGGASWEGLAHLSPDHCADRVEAVGLSGCLQELSLVETVMRGPHPFLSREEVQHFVTE